MLREFQLRILSAHTYKLSNKCGIETRHSQIHKAAKFCAAALRRDLSGSHSGMGFTKMEEGKQESRIQHRRESSRKS